MNDHEELRRRERLTADGVAALDRKIERLKAARAERAKALSEIRSAIAWTAPVRPAGSDHARAR